MQVNRVSFTYNESDNKGKSTPSFLYLSLTPPVPIRHGLNSISGKQYMAIKDTPRWQTFVAKGIVTNIVMDTDKQQVEEEQVGEPIIDSPLVENPVIEDTIPSGDVGVEVEIEVDPPLI